MLGRFTVEDLRYRFFSAIRSMPPEQINRLTDIDYAREMAIIAVRESTGETAGTARLVRNDTDGTQAEFAIAVEPAAKGLGLGTALMGAVLDWGRAQGVVDISGQILAMFVLTVAAAEAAVGLAILVTFFRNRGDIAVDQANMMKG